MPGNMWDFPDEEMKGDLELRVTGAAGVPDETEGCFRILLNTTRGEIQGLLHPVEGGTSAVICVGGAMGGLDGPADKLYARLPALLSAAGITVLRLNYREPNKLEECVLDVLAGVSFMKGIGATSFVFAGHSFGGAVVIKAGELSPAAVAVVSMSPQLFGTRQVEQLGKPLLLIHGMADTILSHEASEDIYARARDPKQLVLYPDAGHSLRGTEEQLDALLAEWIPGRLSG
jgi:alpha/beta superfamily hydrolase